MRIKAWSLLGLLTLLLVAVAFSAASAGARVSHLQFPPTPPPPRTDRGAPNLGPIGAPAIHPTRDPSTNGGAAFTAADVEQFIQTNGYAGGPTVSGKPPTILKILFVTSKEAGILLNGQDVGLPDDALVCYVLLNGPFYETAIPPYVPNRTPPPTPLTYQTGYAVFDALTGNLLMYSA